MHLPLLATKLFFSPQVEKSYGPGAMYPIHIPQIRHTWRAAHFKKHVNLQPRLLVTMPFEKAIIHAGIQKTASTSLQYTLHSAENKKLLLEKSLYYAYPLGRNHSVPATFLVDPSGTFLWQGLRPRPRQTIREKNRTIVEQIKLAGESLPAKNLVISGEDIVVYPEPLKWRLKKYLSRVFGIKDFRIILYVRNPVSYHVSMRQEWVKLLRPFFMKYPQPSELHALEGDREYPYAFDFKKNIESLFTVFGRDNVEIYKFEDFLGPDTHGPVEHFLSLLGFADDEIQQFVIYKRNSSICAEIYNLLEFAGTRYADQLHHAPDESPAESLSPQDCKKLRNIKGKKYDAPASTKRTLASYYKPDVIWLNEHCNIDYTDKLSADDDKTTAHDTEVSFDTTASLEILNSFTNSNTATRKLVIEYFAHLMPTNMPNVTQVHNLAVLLDKAINFRRGRRKSEKRHCQKKQEIAFRCAKVFRERCKTVGANQIIGKKQKSSAQKEEIHFLETLRDADST